MSLKVFTLNPKSTRRISHTKLTLLFRNLQANNSTRKPTNECSIPTEQVNITYKEMNDRVLK